MDATTLPALQTQASLPKTTSKNTWICTPTTDWPLNPKTAVLARCQSRVESAFMVYVFKNQKNNCLLYRPARSKHCSMCKGCVARSDHHCAWVNICVGHNNHRYFLLFLFALWQFLTYAVYVTFSIYRGKIVKWGLDNAVIKDALTGEEIPLSFRKAMLVNATYDDLMKTWKFRTLTLCVLFSIFFKRIDL